MAEPFDIVIFGGSGDLALRKLVPALYRAHREGKLPAGTRIVASCLDPDDVKNYSENIVRALREYLAPEEFCLQAWEQFEQFLTPLALDIAVMDQQWQNLGKLLNSDPDISRVFYLAIPPAIFGVCCKHLAEVDLVSGNSRVVVEKPLG